MGQGPLAGLRVLEFAGIGPAPFCAMMLSDMGAEVLRIDRPGGGASPRDVTARGRTSLALDLKTPEAQAAARAVAARADILIEGFRPGVMERLGLGPADLHAVNPKLVYGRMTGWGQEGPLAQTAGHDIGYIALTGALAAIGPANGAPTPPLNLVGDYGGGALYLAVGLLAALHEAKASGRGQVVDAAVVDGAASLMSIMSWLQADRMAQAKRGSNFLDGSAPFYRCYRCADGEWVAVGAIEPHFYRQLLAGIAASEEELALQYDPEEWAGSAERLAELFARRSRADWVALFDGSDACLAPVLSLDEAPQHPHMAARETFVEAFGVTQPAPAPRFSRTPSAIQGAPPAAGDGGAEMARSWGVPMGHLGAPK